MADEVVNNGVVSGTAMPPRSTRLQHGNPGRPKGSRNRTTVEAQQLAQRMVNDRKYQRRLWERWRAGTLHPRIEELIWAYAFGRPRVSVDLHASMSWLDRLPPPKPEDYQ